MGGEHQERTFTIPCPNCGGRLRILERHAGRPGKCVQCGGSFTAVPGHGATPDSSPPSRWKRIFGGKRAAVAVLLLAGVSVLCALVFFAAVGRTQDATPARTLAKPAVSEGGQSGEAQGAKAPESQSALPEHVIMDPSGDASPGAPGHVDIQRLAVKQSGSNILFKWDLGGNPRENERQYYFLAFDTDLDAGTGQRWGDVGAELKVRIHSAADLVYFTPRGEVFKEILGRPVSFDRHSIYLSLKREDIPACRFRLYFESSGETPYADRGSTTTLELDAAASDARLVVEADGIVLKAAPPLINIPQRGESVQLHCSVEAAGGRTLLSPEQVEYEVFHPVQKPGLGSASSVISVDQNGMARYHKEGFVFVRARLNDFSLMSERVIIATGTVLGNPGKDRVIGVFPLDYVPSGSQHSFGWMVEHYPDFITTLNTAYDVTSELYAGFRPFGGETQVLALLILDRHCGGNNNPLETAPSGYMEPARGTPQYTLIMHELGHNFALSQGMCRLLQANGGKLARAGLAEAVASLPVIYIAREFQRRPESYGISRDSFEWQYFDQFLQRDIPYARNQLAEFEGLISRGKAKGLSDGNAPFDHVAAFAAIFQMHSYGFADEPSPHGNQMIRRFLGLFGGRELADFDGLKVETYFAAAYCHAAGLDMRGRLRFWGFVVDDIYFDRLSHTMDRGPSGLGSPHAGR